MTYHSMNRLGDWPADTIWNPGAGQTPRNDPRIVKRYATVRGTWRPAGIDRAAASSVPSYLLAAVKSALPGWTVKLVGNGWNADGQVELSVIVPSDTAAGTIKGAFFDATTFVNAQRTSSGYKVLGATGSLVSPMTYINASDIKLPPAATTPSTTPGATTAPVTPTADGSTATPDTTGITSTVSGIPLWAVGVGGVAIVGVLGYLALSGGKKKATATVGPAAPVAANRRRYRRAA